MFTITRKLTAVAGTAAAVLMLAAPHASAATSSGNAAGLQIECVMAGTPVTFTTIGGTFHEIDHVEQNANGVHFTGTLSLQGVTATDGTTNEVYSIVGSSWYGGNGSSFDTATVRSTDEFNILGSQGKVADIHASLTFYPDGTVRGVSFGDCAPAA